MKRKWIAVGLLIAVFFVGFAFVREYLRNRDYAAEVRRLEAENAALEQNQLAAVQFINQLSTETQVEGDARTKLNLAKEGEEVFVVTDAEGRAQGALASSAQESLVAQDAGLSNPARWLYYFFAPNNTRAL